MAQYSDLIKSHLNDETPLDEVLETIAIELTKLHDITITVERLKSILTIVEKLSKIKLRWEDYEKAPEFPEITLDNAIEIYQVMDYLNIDLSIVNIAIILIMKQCVVLKDEGDAFVFSTPLSIELTEVLNKELQKWNLELQRIFASPIILRGYHREIDKDFQNKYRVKILLDRDIPQNNLEYAAIMTYRIGLAFRLEKILEKHDENHNNRHISRCALEIKAYYDKQIHDECVSLLYRRWPDSIVIDRYAEQGFLYSGRMDILEDLIAKGHPFSTTHTNEYNREYGALEVLASIGNIDGLKLLLQHGYVLNDNVLDAAIGFITEKDAPIHNKAMIEYLVGVNCPRPDILIRHLAKSIELMKYFCSQGYVWHENDTYHIVNNGTVECLQFALDHGCPVNGSTISWLVERHFNTEDIIPMMKILRSQEPPALWNNPAYLYEVDVFTKVCRRGLLPVIQYMFENGCPYNSTAYQTNLVEVIRYLHEQGVPWTLEAYQTPVRRDNIDAIQYLRTNGCPMNSSIIIFHAIYDGKISMVQYLHEQGFPWNEDSFDHAIETYNRELIQYMKDQGCPWNSNAYLSACHPRYYFPNDAVSRFSAQEMFDFLYDNGCPWEEDLINKVKALVRRTVPLRGELCQWAASKSLPM